MFEQRREVFVKKNCPKELKGGCISVFVVMKFHYHYCKFIDKRASRSLSALLLAISPKFLQ
jgi:hypothetical protein